MGSEASGFEEAADDVVGEVAETEGRAAEVPEPTIDRLRWTVAGAGPVEERQHVLRALGQRPVQLSQLDESVRPELDLSRG